MKRGETFDSFDIPVLGKISVVVQAVIVYGLAFVSIKFNYLSFDTIRWLLGIPYVPILAIMSYKVVRQWYKFALIGKLTIYAGLCNFIVWPLVVISSHIFPQSITTLFIDAAVGMFFCFAFFIFAFALYDTFTQKR